ncbi:hypothetical protein DFA_06987 [Cavenderia fasciculata]|uniref:V-type proton ATPase subunit S1/VOA1 transmembrane domain-containing protein n=1 Tax=Cavenderia fasciculata TaxID=261658 RepID=F4PX81_CACFS|nr:uncharacterized protein DFA_06987 [Cavenderia fasciculata]EGG19884.1 hypothetical protein DFA_06987 [Cavenderia fasciculata]|eukprot:XP_004366867.1 hypothetical protein DFA_06987 [Cavenderia fasciculata]
MKFALSLIILSAICCSVAFAASLNIPIIGWSNEKIFLQNEVINTFEASQFESMLNSMIKGQSTPLIKKHMPELITIFVEDTLRTDELSTILGSYKQNSDGGDLSAIKSNMESAGSSVFIPYATTSGNFVSSILNSLASDFQGQIYVASESASSFKIAGASHIELTNIKKSLPSSIFSNQVADILVVVLPKTESYAQHNEHIKQVSKIVESKDTVTFFTAENITPLSFNLDQENEVVSSFGSRAFDPVVNANSSSGSNSSASSSSSSSGGKTGGGDDYFNYFTGPVLETYLVVMILLAILFTGICCIGDLQVPDRYEAPKQKIL